MFNFFKSLVPKSTLVAGATGTVQAHAQSRTLQETVYYPTHPTRGAESAEFEATKKKLIAAGVGCAICGVLNTPENPLEGHHVVSEWAMQNATNFDKVKKDFPNTTATDVATFIDGENGIILLCAKHHRSNLRGIHMITFPAWIFQRYSNDGWDLVNGPNAAAEPEDESKWYPEH